jgi:PPOX class probable F420-dependent enzyme
MPAIHEEYHDLFEKRTFAHFASLLPDGTPHVVPVWVDYDEDADRLLVNSTTERRKTRNVERNPSVAVSMLDPDDPYRYLGVHGEVTEVTTDGAVEHIHELSRRYFGREYRGLDDEAGERAIIRVRPDHVL